MADTNGLSTRMSKSVASMLPHIAATIAERTSKGPAKIDLATAENWLLRPELLEICKDAIAQNLTADVSKAIFSSNIVLSLIIFRNFPTPVALAVTQIFSKP